MCKDAVDTVLELEHMGLPFDRTPEGHISQRPFGGHTNNVTKQPVRRACHAADRTGHMILQTLYQQCIKNERAVLRRVPGSWTCWSSMGQRGRRRCLSDRHRRAARLSLPRR